MSDIIVRKAVEQDVPAIHELLEYYADLGIVLRRTREDIMLYLGNFFVAEKDGVIRGCSAVRDFGNDLLEIRSLVISPDFRGQGIGKKLILAIIEHVASTRESWQLFTLTGEPLFFGKLGFKTVNRERFPEKIWSDCRNCSKNTCCDEVALIYTDKSYRAALSQW